MSHAWAKDIAWVKANYMTMTNKEMALQLGVHPGTLRVQLHAMNLRRTVKISAVGNPCPPRDMDLMHAPVYVPSRSVNPRGEDEKYPSLGTGIAATYKDRGHV